MVTVARRPAVLAATVLALVTVLVTVLVAGCATPLRTPGTGPIPLAVGWTETEPSLLVHNYDERSSAVARRLGADSRYRWGLLVIGRLGYLGEHGCFVIEAEDGRRGWPVAWPLGTTPVRRGGALAGVDVPGYGEVPLGAEIEARGEGTVREAGWAEVPPDCHPPDRDPDDLLEYLFIHWVNRAQ
jgi:hypothetical protein